MSKFCSSSARDDSVCKVESVVIHSNGCSSSLHGGSEWCNSWPSYNISTQDYFVHRNTISRCHPPPFLTTTHSHTYYSYTYKRAHPRMHARTTPTPTHRHTYTRTHDEHAHTQTHRHTHARTHTQMTHACMHACMHARYREHTIAHA